MLRYGGLNRNGIAPNLIAMTNLFTISGVCQHQTIGGKLEPAALGPGDECRPMPGRHTLALEPAVDRDHLNGRVIAPDVLKDRLARRPAFENVKNGVILCHAPFYDRIGHRSIGPTW